MRFLLSIVLALQLSSATTLYACELEGWTERPLCCCGEEAPVPCPETERAPEPRTRSEPARPCCTTAPAVAGELAAHVGSQLEFDPPPLGSGPADIDLPARAPPVLLSVGRRPDDHDAEPRTYLLTGRLRR
jgi:hypothetical protein